MSQSIVGEIGDGHSDPVALYSTRCETVQSSIAFMFRYRPLALDTSCIIESHHGSQFRFAKPDAP